MFRYFKLYTYFLKFSFSKAAQFRLDFFFRIIMDVVFYGVILLFFDVIFNHTSSLGGFTKEQIYIFIGGYFFVDAVQMTFFSTNIWVLPALINKGDLDYYLVRPISSLFFVTLREFAANSFINLFFAVGIIWWALARYSEPLSVLGVILFFIALCLSSILFVVLNLFFILPVFWTHSPRGLSDLFWPLTRIMERPDSIYEGWFKRITTTVLPVAIISSYPAYILFQENRWLIFGLHFFIVTCFCSLLGFCWKLALKNYSSASS